MKQKQFQQFLSDIGDKERQVRKLQTLLENLKLA